MTEPSRIVAGLSLGEHRADALARATAHVASAWAEFDSARPEEHHASPELLALLQSSLPAAPSDVLQMIDRAAEVLDASLAQARPRFFAFIGSSGLEVGALADLLAHTYDVNLAVDARAATQLEWQTINWLADFLGFPAHSGTFTSGGTISNMTALAAAREAIIPGSRKRGLVGVRPTIYCSSEAHYSNIRAAEMLGIGADFVRSIAIDSERRMDPADLRHHIESDIAAGYTPIAIVATTGTTLTGAIDPIDALADIAQQFGIWLHIDGAYGMPAASVPALRSMFAGLERVDSVTVDCHKWMFVPKACSAVLVKDTRSLASTFSHNEAYMPHEGENFNAVDITLEYSRPLRALKLWLAFATHGADAFRAAIYRNCEQAQMLWGLAVAHPALETLTNRPQLSVVPIRHVVDGCADINAHNTALCAAIQNDGRVFLSPATIDGGVWLRPCFTNFRTSDDDIRVLVDVVLELGADCATLHP